MVVCWGELVAKQIGTVQSSRNCRHAETLEELKEGARSCQADFLALFQKALGLLKLPKFKIRK